MLTHDRTDMCMRSRDRRYDRTGDRAKQNTENSDTHNEKDC